MKFNFLRKLRAILFFWREARYTLLGHRDREIRLDIDELRGAIAALHLDRFIQTCAKPHGCADLAVVTCLPPDETGIARFSEMQLTDWPEDVDVYTHITDLHKIVHAQRTMQAKHAGISLFSVESLAFNHLKKHYRNIVFVIGNSDHNVVLLKALRSFVESFGPEGVHCYLHDPACFNVTRRTLNMTERDFARYLAELHEKTAKDIIGTKKYIFDYFIDAGIYGPRIISHSFGVKNFIVNSRAGEEIIRSNCGDRHPRVGVLFHPVFELEAGVTMADSDERQIVIGSYGCPSLNKLTDVIIDACEILVGEGRNIRLILSGYDTNVYVNRHFGHRPPAWIDIRHHSSEAEFQQDMAECDIAVQLRKHNLGESSGVVPTLLKMRKTVITSPIGAFTSYGDAVLYFDGDAEALAALLRKNVRTPMKHIDNFVSAHGVSKFNEALLAILTGARLSAPTPDTQLAGEAASLGEIY